VYHFKAFALGLFTLTITLDVRADGLTDLQQALVKLNGTDSVSALLDVSFSEARGEGKDKKIKTGAIKSTLSENSAGLNISYSKEILNKIALENRLKLENEEADTPALNGAEILSASSLIPILSSAQTILDLIEQGEFTGESSIEYHDKKVRVLDFTLPLESFIDDKKIRGYVSKFDGSFKVLIDDNGVPIETRMSYKGKGSAYIFFSMKAQSEIISQFQVKCSRLVRTKKEIVSNSTSTFSDRTYNGTWLLDLH
jgi:hypothetical protein